MYKKYISLLLLSVIIAMNTIGWFTYPPKRTVSNLGQTLSDIDSHLPAGHIYRDSDKVTWGHESTHGINSQIRQEYGGTGKINGAYVLGNNAIVLREPKVTIAQVANLTRYKGNVYQLYLVQQRQYWNNEPLYIALDEATSYMNGSVVGIEHGLNRSESLIYAIEFRFYCEALLAAIEQYDPQYIDKALLKEFIDWGTRRTILLVKIAKDSNSPMYAEFQEKLIQKLQNVTDTAPLLIPILPPPHRCIMTRGFR